MHADFQVLLFGYDRADTASANWIWRASSGGGLPVDLVSVKYSDLSEGRCDACEVIIVGTKADIDALGIDVDQEIRFYVRGVSEGAASLRYYGYIKELDQGVGTHDRMRRTLIIGGLMEQLDEVLAYRYYNDCFVGMSAGPYGGLVENLLTDVIIGESNVNVVNSFTEIDTVSTLIRTTDFPDVPVAEAISRLAITEGDVVYGVDQQAKLFFKKRPATYAHTFQIGQDGVKVIQLNKSNYNVKNTYIVRCKTLMAGGELAFEVVDDRLASNPDIRVRVEAVNTPEFGDNTGAVDFGEALIEQNRDPSEPIRLEIADFSDQMWAYENINLKDELGISFGSFPIKALHWDISPKKCRLSVELGEIEPDLSEQARLLLRFQRIGAAREFSNNIELIGERYAWLIVARREFANQFQTRNFWGYQTDNTDSMDLPHPDTVTDDQYPVFDGSAKAVSGVPIPRDIDGSCLDITTIKSKQVEVGVVRDYVALGIDNEFRKVLWEMNEFNEHCRVQDLGAMSASFVSRGYLHPYKWEGSSGIADTIVWYEAIMSLWTDLTISLITLRNLSASSPNEQLHIYWDASIDTDNYPPEDNAYHVMFDNIAGTLWCYVYEEYLGATTLKWSGSVPMSTIANSPLTKVYINRRSGTSELSTRVIVSHWITGATEWTVLFDSGNLNLVHRLTSSFWGVRWAMNATYNGSAHVSVRHVWFSGDTPILNVSRDEGEHWKQVEPEVLYDISGEPVIGTSLKMKIDLTHYHLLHGWCMAFK